MPCFFLHSQAVVVSENCLLLSNLLCKMVLAQIWLTKLTGDPKRKGRIIELLKGLNRTLLLLEYQGKPLCVHARVHACVCKRCFKGNTNVRISFFKQKEQRKRHADGETAFLSVWRPHTCNVGLTNIPPKPRAQMQSCSGRKRDRIYSRD